MPAAEGRAQLAQPAPAISAPTLRQLHFQLPTRSGASLYLPAVPRDASLWVNGMVGSNSESSGYFGAGFGPARLSLQMQASRLSFEDNRIDIVALSGWTRGRWNLPMPVVLLMPVETGPAFTTMMLKAEARLSLGALVLGVAGLLFSVIGLALSPRKLLYVGGAVFAMALIDQAFGVLPLVLRLAMALIGIAVLLVRGGWQSKVASGCAIAALAGAVAGTILLSKWTTGIHLAWAANVVLWPLAGFGLPVLALADARLLRSEFIAARVKIRNQAAVISQQEGELQDRIRTQAVSEERQRFVRDMHDGVGGHLLSLLMRVRADDASSQDVAEELEKGLTDLRLMADSLDHVGHDLDQALAAFHRRAGQQLAAAGLDFDWSKHQQLSGFKLEARAVLSLYRIIQEALSNCVRHARAGRFGVSFDLAEDGARLDIVIEDDGVGFLTGSENEGRGLANIRKRAERLGGLVEFGPGGSGRGCRIQLTIPAG